MSEKTLGQVAREAFHAKPMRHSGPDEDWERAAQAVVAELVADVRSPESKAAFAIVGALLKAEGAAAERERLASILEDGRSCRNLGMQSHWEHVSKWLRAGGKP